MDRAVNTGNRYSYLCVRSYRRVLVGDRKRLFKCEDCMDAEMEGAIEAKVESALKCRT